jgi:hypothetical protein
MMNAFVTVAIGWALCHDLHFADGSLSLMVVTSLFFLLKIVYLGS